MKLIRNKGTKVWLILTCFLLLFQNSIMAADTTSSQLISLKIQGSFNYPAPTQIQVTGTYDDGTKVIPASSVTWKTDTNNVISVSNGFVSFTGNAGTASVWAELDGKKSNTLEAKVVVEPMIIGNLAYSTSSVKLTFVDKYPDGSTRPITGVSWSSSNTNVATVNSSGEVTFRKKQGDVTITASAQGGAKKASKSTMVPYSALSISPTVLNYKSKPSSPVQLTAYGVNYDNTSVKLASGVTWTSSDTSIATIDSSTGKLTFTGNGGSTLITASYLDFSSTVVATLDVPIKITELIINDGASLEYNPSGVVLSVKGRYSDNRLETIKNDQLTWKSSNSDIATVTAGKVTFTGKSGTVTITATSGSGSSALSGTITGQVSLSTVGNFVIVPSSGSFGYSQSSVSLVAKDDTKTLTSVAQWRSSDDSIATVDKGVVKFTGKNGTVTIFATYGSKTTSISTTVNLIASSLTMKGTLAYNVNPVQLSAEVLWPDNRKQTLSTANWRSSDTSIATVSNTGQVKFTGENGPVTIYVSFANKTASMYTNVVNTKTVKSIRIDQSLFYSKTPVTLTVTATLADGSTKKIPTNDVYWTSSDPDIANIYNGVLSYTGRNGTLKVTAEYNSKTATQTGSINSSLVYNALAINETLAYSTSPVTLTLTGTLANGTKQSVSSSYAVWNSSDQTIATVSTSGVVTFTGKNGPVTISASYGNRSASIYVNVNVANALSNLVINETLVYNPNGTRLTLTGTLLNGTRQVISNATWKSSDTTIANVSNGYVTFTGKNGPVTITATYGGKTATAYVNVNGVVGGTNTPFNSSLINNKSIETKILDKIRNTQPLNAINNYTDAGAHWASRDIKIAKKLELVSGYSDGTFRPDNKVTREEFVVMVSRIFDIQPSSYGYKSFTDISQSYAKDYITSLSNMGIIGGYSDQTFKPQNQITRAEVVTILSKLLNFSQLPVKGNSYFYDTSSHWANSAITQVSSIGLVSGRGDGTFAPDDNTSRAEAISLLIRVLSLNSAIKSKIDELN